MINHLNLILYFLPYFSILFLSYFPSYSFYPFGFPLATDSSTLFISSFLPCPIDFSSFPYPPSLTQRLLHRYFSLTSSAVSC